MEEILHMREQMGSKEFSKKISKPKMEKERGNFKPSQPTESDAESKKRPNLAKHAPEEMSSKKRPKMVR